ncbi:MAG: zinc ribbon domain-containing protein [Eubacterium sp.]|nr:zinc ribbon domain-containing protein [Eubacterium sp.]
MALVKCPECGREKVSDSAEACPACGYAIKSHYDKIKYAEMQKAQMAAQTERLRQIQEESQRRKRERKNKLFGSPAKKIMWISGSCVFLALIVVLCLFIHKEKEISNTIRSSHNWFDDIQEKVSELQDNLDDIDFVFTDSLTFLQKEQIQSVENTLSDIDMYKRFIDSDCDADNRIIVSLNSYITRKTSYKSWDEYKQFLTDKYFVSDTIENSTIQLVKARTYSSDEERREAIRSKSVIVESLNHSSSGNYYEVYGTVTNNTLYTVKFVKVKVSMQDAEGKVIDTKTTYACGDEGLKPGETTKFECYVEKDSRIESFTAEIYEYD